MKESKNHLDIDLEFLDKKEPVRVAPKPEPIKKNEPTRRYYESNNVSPNSGKKYNWKNILIVGGLILFFGWGIFSDNENSSSTPSSTNTSNYTSTNSNTSSSNNIATGKYMCSQYNHDRAGELEPSKLQESTLNFEESALVSEGDRLSAEGDEIKNEYVDEYSQYSIDNHNAAVDAINSKLASYRNRLTKHQQSIDAYNAKVEVYNNFLIKNCTPQ